MSEETLDTGYRCRNVFEPYHRRTQRFSAIVAHRRAGKTVACIADLVDAAIRLKKPEGRFAYIAPLYNQAKDVAWNYLKKYSYPLLASPPNESELRVDLSNGSRIRLYGADNPDRLRGIYLDGVILDEYADMAPNIWGEVIRPLLTDRQGSATFIGTPKGRNNFYEIYKRAGSDPKWFSLMLQASETNILDAAELLDASRDMTVEQYDQEFECSFEAAIMGAYFGREMAEAERDGRISATLKRIDAPIHCAWDFGNGANMAVWAFQIDRDKILVHDFIQISGLYFDGYLKEVKERGYHGDDYVPHDAKVPSFETGRTKIETMVLAGRKPVLIADHKVEDGINSAKLTLAHCTFNSEACAHGIEALRQYRQEWDDKARVFKKTPKHDWASHPADAFRYLAMGWQEIIHQATPDIEPLFKPLAEFTYDQFFELEDSPTRRERV